jgi:hypothetical protein
MAGTERHMSFKASSHSLHQGQFLKSLCKATIASRMPLAGRSPASEASNASKGNYSDEKGHSFTASQPRFGVCCISLAAEAAGCRLCLIACNSRQFDELGFTLDR